VSSRRMGLLSARPLESLPAEANCSGTCTVTSSAAASGTVMTALHLGQGPFLPANFSLTEKRALEAEHTTEIGMKLLSKWRREKSAHGAPRAWRHGPAIQKKCVRPSECERGRVPRRSRAIRTNENPLVLVVSHTGGASQAGDPL